MAAHHVEVTRVTRSRDHRRRSSPRTRRLGPVALAVGALVLVAAPQHARAGVPDWRGLQIDDAVDAVFDWRDDLDVVVEPSSFGDLDRAVVVVIDQRFISGQIEQTEDVVALAAGVAVPPVVGLRIDDAFASLAKSGLGVVSEGDTSNAEVVAVGQDPVPGALVPLRTRVVVAFAPPEPEQPTTVVPDLVGRDVPAATELAVEFGLEPETRFVGDGDEPGLVVDQDPPPGTEVDVGSTVVAVVELVPAPTEEPVLVAVPDVSGQDGEAAAATLAAAGLPIAVDRVESPDADAEAVVAQAPPAGDLVPPGTTVRVSLVVPAPPPEVEPPADEEPTVEVPDLRDLDLDDAGDVADVLGLELVRGSGPADGRIVTQEPPPGAEVPVGTAVTVALVDPLVAPTPAPTVDEEDPGPVLVVLAAIAVVGAGAALLRTRWRRRRRVDRATRPADVSQPDPVVDGVRFEGRHAPPPSVDVAERPDAPPSVSVGVAVRPDPGEQSVEERR